MKILIDADGCPVVDITVNLGRKYNINTIIMCDTSHIINKVGVDTVVLSKGSDSVDFALVNKVSKGDIPTVPILDHTTGVREGCASAASAPAAGGRFECRQR